MNGERPACRLLYHPNQDQTCLFRTLSRLWSTSWPQGNLFIVEWQGLLIVFLYFFLLPFRQNLPLWAYEDITAKVWSVRSAEQLDTFVQHVARVFRQSLPHAAIGERWAQTALQLGLSCSSRHYAGRSLQVYRALRVPITGRMLSDILSRLVETVSEQGEDMQVCLITLINCLILYI